MTLGEKLQELRKANKMSQEKIAESLGISRQAVSKWETGSSNPNTENLICLAEIFKVSVKEITNSNLKVALVIDPRKKIDMKTDSKKIKFIVGTFLFLFIATCIY